MTITHHCQTLGNCLDGHLAWCDVVIPLPHFKTSFTCLSPSLFQNHLSSSKDQIPLNSATATACWDQQHKIHLYLITYINMPHWLIHSSWNIVQFSFCCRNCGNVAEGHSTYQLRYEGSKSCEKSFYWWTKKSNLTVYLNANLIHGSKVSQKFQNYMSWESGEKGTVT